MLREGQRPIKERDPMGVGVLDHFNIRIRNLGETVRLYEDVLNRSMSGGLA